ncbi:MAG: hypothetical protein VBE63_24800 [Lamprobacter sp.]|uniref:hypothetical protein n=1 Tax=Lamprobacter sp. TaxID=3100796 RepID=UPI002B25C8BC|nr:hypothetical protein [Lamprobacter sp.]MEA3643133.1 hypothetical protein [Lamprobacter sp.]
MEYKSPLHKLVNFFKESRDKWKEKYQEARREIKSLKNKQYYREKKYRQQEERMRDLEKENKELKESLAQKDREKQETQETQEQQVGLTESFHQTAPNHHYSIGLIQLFLLLVFESSLHLRASARSLPMILNQIFPGIDAAVHWTSVRSWAMRVGYYELTRPKEKADDDWVLIFDHNIQLGSEKCFVIVGFRLSTYEKDRGALQHRDLSLIDLEIVDHSDGSVVYEQIQRAVEKTGMPRALIHDHGSDLHAGVKKFQECHPEVASFYDIKHKTASEIKKILKKDPDWEGFLKIAQSIKSKLQQTNQAHLSPPKLRQKSRYMNLNTRVSWAKQMLDLLDRADASEKEALERSIGELTAYQEPIARWSETLKITDTVERFSRQNWLSRESASQLAKKLNELGEIQYEENKKLKDHLVDFIEVQARQCRENEYLPNSSEVLESLFGKQKYLADTHANQGFGGLVLTFGAMVSDLTTDFIKKALESVPVKAVIEFKDRFPNPSLQAKKKALTVDLKKEQKLT